MDDAVEPVRTAPDQALAASQARGSRIGPIEQEASPAGADDDSGRGDAAGAESVLGQALCRVASRQGDTPGARFSNYLPRQ
jgi:hypothetical protein